MGSNPHRLHHLSNRAQWRHALRVFIPRRGQALNKKREPERRIKQVGQTIFYRAKDMPKLLGVSRGTYYRIVRAGHLPYSRLYVGGPRVHTEEHVEAYLRYLN